MPAKQGSVRAAPCWEGRKKQTGARGLLSVQNLSAALTQPPEATFPPRTAIPLEGFKARFLVRDKKDVYELAERKSDGAWIRISISPRRNVWTSNQWLERGEKHRGLQRMKNKSRIIPPKHFRASGSDPKGISAGARRLRTAGAGQPSGGWTREGDTLCPTGSEQQESSTASTETAPPHLHNSTTR